MTEKKMLTQNEIDRLAELVFAASADKQRDAERHAEERDAIAALVRSKLAIQ